jgi:hypothetical protein
MFVAQETKEKSGFEKKSNANSATTAFTNIYNTGIVSSRQERIKK